MSSIELDTFENPEITVNPSSQPEASNHEASKENLNTNCPEEFDSEIPPPSYDSLDRSNL